MLLCEPLLVCCRVRLVSSFDARLQPRVRPPWAFANGKDNGTKGSQKPLGLTLLKRTKLGKNHIGPQEPPYTII